MVRIGIRELRDNLRTTIRRVPAGEAFEVISDAEPVAVLSPIRSRLEDLIATGRATSAVRPLRPPPRRHPVERGRTSQEILDDLRADRF